MDENFTFLIPGFNVRSTELNALLGLMQLENLDHHIQIRKNNFKVFAEGLNPDLYYSGFDVDENSSFCFPVVSRKGGYKKMQQALTEMGVETRPIVAGNLHRHPFMSNVSQYRYDKNAEVIHEQGFYIGNNQNVTESDVRWLVDILNGAKG